MTPLGPVEVCVHSRSPGYADAFSRGELLRRVPAARDKRAPWAGAAFKPSPRRSVWKEERKRRQLLGGVSRGGRAGSSSGSYVTVSGSGCPHPKAPSPQAPRGGVLGMLTPRKCSSVCSLRVSAGWARGGHGVGAGWEWAGRGVGAGWARAPSATPRLSLLSADIV